MTDKLTIAMSSGLCVLCPGSALQRQGKRGIGDML